MNTRPTSEEFRDALISSLEMPDGFPKDELRTRGLDIWWEKDITKELFTQWRN